MEANYNETDLIEIVPEHIYLTIPTEWVCTYHQLLVAIADLGKNMIDDCSAACKGNSKNIINCWNMFQSAIACRTLGREKEADFLIKYIEKQIDSLYGGGNTNKYTGITKFSITPDGRLKALCTCKNNHNIKFEVDVKTGELYKQYLDEESAKNEFSIENNNLTVSYDLND